ncbi:hypothetical protein CYMTET_35858 [Cymbomonas tetramitiformis]|uniref:Sialidase domain-containing protein n=1 Tax=Cymbomonas tetramitiformis TaxID=36881 RepID=A0AAE0KNP7_9CHLO|nr:hypothetical protein CYMTET_35858 [Cymbomonas tetramitiformis]
MPIPNPNSQVHLMRLEPRGELLLAFNNHRAPGTYRGLNKCKACRTKLHLAISRDNGKTWGQIHSIDDEMSSSAVRLHYPSLVQLGSTPVVAVVYSRFYLGRKMGLTSMEQGIKLQLLDLSGALSNRWFNWIR